MTITALQQSLLTAPLSEEARRLAVLEASLGSASQGVVSLTANQSSGTVTGLGLSFTPTHAELTMQVPANGLGITVILVGAPTADGFAWRTLNGVPDSEDYKFSFRLT